jgi:DNA polymerase-1
LSQRTADLLQSSRFEFVNTIDQAAAFKRWLGERRSVLGVDTETSGLHPESDTLRLVQFGDLNTGWAIPWEGWGGVALEALNTYTGDLVEHNSPFDNRVLQANGWEPRWANTHDTMTEAHLVDPDRPKGLKPLASRFVDAKAVAGQAALDKAMKVHGWDWGTVPVDFDLYWVYGALDPLLTAHVHEHLNPIIKARGYDRAYDLERATSRIATGMMQRGIQVDLEYCERKSRELRAWSGRAREWIKEEFGITNATSNAQVIKRLTDDGIQLIKRTDSGAAFALDKEVLDGLIAANAHPLPAYIKAIRKAEKICGTYLENFSVMVGADGRLRCNINTLGARTGRMSLTEPALQTLHRDDPTVRQAFVPREGCVFISCDYDQIEARLAAHFSEDQGLIDAFNGPDDFFCVIATGMFGETIIKGDPRRQVTKNTIYGSIYAAGIETMARTAGLSPERMGPIKFAFDARYPGLHQMLDGVVAAAQMRKETEGRAYVRTPLGREITVKDTRDYALVNYLIQGTAAEVLKQAMVELDAVGLGDYLVLPIHDELLLEVPRELAQEAMHTVERVMSDLTSFKVPLTSSAVLFEDRWSIKK